MKNNRRIVYNIINILFLFFAFLLFVLKLPNLLNYNISFYYIILLIFIIFLIHILKILKLYFIVLEEQIPFKEMIKLYAKSTFVSIILPYKIGEIYKAYLLGYKLNSYLKGIIAVVIDKFYDAIILCIAFTLYSIYSHTPLLILTWLLIILIVVCLITYFLYPGTYNYLNRFFISSKQTQNRLSALNILERLNYVYLKTKEMIRGRSLILLFMGLLYWFGEAIFILLVLKAQSINLYFREIFMYVNDSFLGINNSIFNVYILLCTLLFLIVLSIIYMKKYLLGGKCEKSNSNI